ncbi:DUF4142 domain-containing protein [bacterium]|nr:DUF4142 domain-containing protein [bacterium]
MKSLLIFLCLGVAAWAIPTRAEYFWAGKAGEVSQEMTRYARLALQRSQDPSVLDSAHRLVREGELNFHRLAVVAESQEFPLSTGPTAAQQQEFRAMAQLTGSAFDRAFLKKEHDCAVALSLCRNQALARSHDPALTQALQGLDMEAATR